MWLGPGLKHSFLSSLFCLEFSLRRPLYSRNGLWVWVPGEERALRVNHSHKKDADWLNSGHTTGGEVGLRDWQPGHVPGAIDENAQMSAAEGEPGRRGGLQVPCNILTVTFCTFHSCT